jgi:hypothetical protein
VKLSKKNITKTSVKRPRKTLAERLNLSKDQLAKFEVRLIKMKERIKVVKTQIRVLEKVIAKG